uniref:Heterogeneous nuclear ribonucleoprotein Q-like n=1 Tax=Sinocyclocheilus anshuiensis TaxID=1608454 RepID=A0A671RH26_9TELE
MATEHINGNGTEEPMDTSAAVTHSDHFNALLEAGLPQKVAEKLDEIYLAGLVEHSELDERALEALKEFNEEGALQVLVQFKESDLSHVQNKSAFLCGVMKTYRQREKQGTKVLDSTKGPDEAKMKTLLERTGYTLDVTTGQRKYGGPPPESVYTGAQPTVGTEIFVGKIPRDLFEDELVPLFEKAGPIWDLRLMMDPLSGLNRGYAFLTFCTKEAAQEAVKLCNNHEIRPGKHIGVCISVANNRLFVGSIPKSKTKEQIVEEFSKVTEGLTDVILYHQPDDKRKNRGFCFLEYEDHKTAAQARRRLMSGKVKVWGNVVTVEWADPIEDPDPEVMAKVKVLFVRNLANSVTEEILEKAFGQFGKLERVKKLKDYAFIHYDERDGAVKALAEMNGKDLEGEHIEIVFAKPPDQKRKERKAQRQAAKTQICHLLPGAGAGVPVGVVTPTRQTIMAMKITTIIMVMITITTGAATTTRTSATMTSRRPLEAEWGAVGPEAGRLRCAAEGPALHGAGRASRSAVAGQGPAGAHTEEPEAGFNVGLIVFFIKRVWVFFLLKSLDWPSNPLKVASLLFPAGFLVHILRIRLDSISSHSHLLLPNCFCFMFCLEVVNYFLKSGLKFLNLQFCAQPVYLAI